MAKAPTTQRTSTEAAADRVQRLTDTDLTQPLDVPGRPAGNGAPVASDGDGAQADPTRATVGDFKPAVAAVAAPPAGASRSSQHPSVERTGSGRPLVPAGDVDLGKAMVALAEIAEHGRWATTYQAHIDRVRWLHGFAGRASAELAERRHVPPGLWAELAAQVQGWNGRQS